MSLNEPWDCVVIGAGPAGMVCAGRLAGSGLRVLILEKNPQVGRKLVLSGSGRCNILCSEEDPDELARCFTSLPEHIPEGKSKLPLHPPQVRSLFRSWPPEALSDFLQGPEGPGISLVKDGAKYFPESDSARQVKTALQSWAEQAGAAMRINAPVTGLSCSQGTWKTTVVTGEVIESRKVVLATGGASWPVTGSSGDTATLATGLKHPVQAWLPALGALVIQGFILGKRSGSGPDRRLMDHCPGQALPCRLDFAPVPGWPRGFSMEGGEGDILFTHQGLSGPLILRMSGRIAWLMARGIKVVLCLDLLPGMPMAELEALVEEKRQSNPRAGFGGIFSGFLSARLVKELMEGLGIDPGLPLSRLRKEDRTDFLKCIKGLKAQVKSVEGLESAMQSTGGFAVQDLAWPSMEAKALQGFHVIGDAVSLDRPSGGYSLSFCWASALAASRAIATDLTQA